MKKTNFAILIASAFLVAACNGEKPEHTFSDAWSSDATNHWHACNVAGCSDVVEQAAHTFNWVVDSEASYEADGSKHEECTICHYKKDSVTIPQLVHNYDTAQWAKDATDHWHACTDTGFAGKANGSDVAAHTWDGEYTELSAATYESAQKLHRTCTVCGYEDIKDGDPALVHNYEEVWTSDDTDHWHKCLDEGFEGKENGKDLAAHNLASSGSEVAPTYTTAGQTVGGTCSVCGKVIQGYTIPALNETDYTRTATNDHKQTMTETWTLKDPASIGKESYVVSKSFTWGFIMIADYSTGKQVKHDYTPYEFNKTFEGITLTADESTKTLTLNVTKEGGYTFENICLAFPSTTVNKVIITGEPLTINCPEGCSDDGLSFWCSTNVASMCTAIIDTDVSVIYSDQYTTANTKNGINESYLTINEGASLKVSGFKYGIKACYTPITVNGTMVVSGTTQAIVSSSSSKVRTIKIANGYDVYFDGQKQTIDNNQTTTTILGTTKKLAIIPEGSDIANY